MEFVEFVEFVGGVGVEAREPGWVFARDWGCDGRVDDGVDRWAWERVTVGRVWSDVGCSSFDVVGSSGAVAAWVWSPVPRSSEATVSPPPTRATAVATTARRWFFFQRASCRRRAARPCGAGGVTLSRSGESGESSEPGEESEFSGAGAGEGAAMIWGAMSGA
ncbi:hypothetical protein SAMN05444521_4332 [Streptomyces sp. 3214.6]|nr:hypothetical protein SAMN05444521_4332 [Streptomyces sp. 3214.6]